MIILDTGLRDFVVITLLSFRASGARRRACPVLDTGESSNCELVPVLRRDDVWMPVFTGMTTLIALFAIATQSLRRHDIIFDIMQFCEGFILELKE